MNRFEIRDILQAHKEHFRVLPTNALVALQGIIEAVDEEEKGGSGWPKTIYISEKKKPKTVVKEKSPAAKFTTGIKKKKAKKKGK